MRLGDIEVVVFTCPACDQEVKGKAKYVPGQPIGIEKPEGKLVLNLELRGVAVSHDCRPHEPGMRRGKPDIERGTTLDEGPAF